MKAKEEIVILVIDDDPAVKAMTVAALGRFGFKNILQADSGEEGIKMIKEHNPVLVITDLTLPGMRGEELIRRCKLNFPHIKIIAISGDEEQTARLAVMAAGGDGLLCKPFNPQDLKKMVEFHLAQA